MIPGFLLCILLKTTVLATDPIWLTLVNLIIGHVFLCKFFDKRDIVLISCYDKTDQNVAKILVCDSGIYWWFLDRGVIQCCTLWLAYILIGCNIMHLSCIISCYKKKLIFHLLYSSLWELLKSDGIRNRHI